MENAVSGDDVLKLEEETEQQQYQIKSKISENGTVAVKTGKKCFAITGMGYTSELLQEVEGCQVIDEENLGETKFDDEDILYIPSESSLQEVIRRLPPDSKKRMAIENLKDKLQSRILMENMFEDFHFGFFKLEQLASLQNILGQETWVLKPRRGFFGVGVEVTTPETDFAAAEERIRRELKAQQASFGESVLSTNDMIFETFVEGEEVAVDMFFNASAKPVIVNIFRHPLREDGEYFHTLYYSSRDMFSRHLETLLDLFSEFNEKLGLTSFPIHAEFKMLEDEDLIPIEFNPLRFGGYGLGDLPYFAYGFNPFVAFFQDRTIDWDRIWGTDEENKEFGFVLGYVGTQVDPENSIPNHQAFQEFLGPGLLGYKSFDHRINPVFCVAYVHLHHGDKQRILTVDYNDFFVKAEPDQSSFLSPVTSFCSIL